MWWYYKCVNLIKVLIQGSKVIPFVTWECLARASLDVGGAPPRTDALIGPAAFGDVQKTDCLKRRASGAPSLFSLDSLELWNSSKLRFPFCGYALQRAPVRWTLTSEPTIGGGLRLCQSRNGATNSTIAEESFPGDVTQPSQVSTREQPKEPELTTWPRNKELNSRGKTKRSKSLL